jgi:hypothetical protein
LLIAADFSLLDLNFRRLLAYHRPKDIIKKTFYGHSTISYEKWKSIAEYQDVEL